MRTRACVLALLLSGVAHGAASVAASTASPASAPMPARGTLQVAFSPWDDVEELIVNELDEARRQVRVQAYLLTSKKIGAALVRAHRRGVDSRILLDAEQLRKTDSSQAPKLAAAGLPIWLETAYQNAHNKVIVIDGDTVITGSFNFTWTAQHKNAENILIARGNAPLAGRYLANWERHRQEAIPYIQ